MLATAIIVFREVFEAALIIGIVLAATKGVAGRGRWVSAGIAAGVLSACIVAFFAEGIANMAAGMGQELFNACILFAAVVMLGWHNIWMGRHGREMAREMKAFGGSVAEGGRPLHALSIVVGIAVLREGSEIVLFLYGIAVSGGEAQVAQMIVGGLIGLAGGALVGGALYAGLLRVSTRYIHAVTTWMILFLAAGLASQGAAKLVQADMIPAFGFEMWDTSSFLAEDSMVGQALKTLVGYTDRPSGIQLMFYAATLLVIGVLMHVMGRKTSRPSNTAAAE